MSKRPTRRSFIEQTLIVLIVVPLAACGDDGESESRECDGAGATSSVNMGHSHFVCIPSSDLVNPPGTGGTYTTTLDDGHTHEVTLTAADLEELAGNGSVNVTSTLDDGHTHSFVLERRD